MVQQRVRRGGRGRTVAAEVLADPHQLPCNQHHWYIYIYIYSYIQIDFPRPCEFVVSVWAFACMCIMQALQVHVDVCFWEIKQWVLGARSATGLHQHNWSPKGGLIVALLNMQLLWSVVLWHGNAKTCDLSCKFINTEFVAMHSI